MAIQASMSHLYILLDNTFLRSSLLNIDDPADHHSFFASSAGSSLHDGPRLRATIDNSGIEALSPDNVSQMRIFANHTDTGFDLTYRATSTALINGGMGEFTVGNGRTYGYRSV
ncbi:hypothetical protein BDV59DRAFT_201006 [Aspergillus ambiguus]|uniref:uncharacterized protein n=1 Tax=Aspergillus ambiguus TaxID=176160 RepID=UPI003CCDBA3D